ncbi:MAG: CpaF family protein [Actinomycetota bacterium]
MTRMAANGDGASTRFAGGGLSTIDPDRVKRLVRSRLLREARRELDRLDGPAGRLRVRQEVIAVLREERAILPAGVMTDVVNQVSDEVVGLGPIERLLKDPEVSEVMVNGADDVFVERKGRVERVRGLLFEGEEQVLHLIERIVSPLGLRVDESSPFVDARLPDGSRVNAIIRPLSLCGPVVTVRKFSLRPLGPDDLVRLGTITEPMVSFLASSVRARSNIIVSGGTGTGKTTLLGVLSAFIPPRERLITIEDAAELRLPQPHVVSLEARPPNVEGAGEVTVRALVRNALRMRPDRIIVGEVRGGEALDMLQAMNTGHEGSMSTAHANSPRDVLTRLETMALMSDVDLPMTHVRDQIASAVDLIVHMTRLPDGRRAVARISAVEGIRRGEIILEDVFVWKRTPGPGFEATPKLAALLELLAQRDERADPRVFRGMITTNPAHASNGNGSGSHGSGSPSIRPHPPISLRPVRPAEDRIDPGAWPGSLRRLGSILE